VDQRTHRHRSAGADPRGVQHGRASGQIGAAIDLAAQQRGVRPDEDVVGEHYRPRGPAGGGGAQHRVLADDRALPHLDP
jgi:hypothetical protein